MNIKLMLSAISKSINELDNSPKIERYKLYAFIKQIENEIISYVNQTKEEGDVLDKNNASLYFTEMDTPLKCMVGLEDNGHSFEQNQQWCRAAIQKLKSVHCFDIHDVA